MPRRLAPLGTVSVDEFMRRYWQRRPLLIRNAFPDFQAPIGRDDLFALAASDEVESRIVSVARQRWSLHHGPFDPETHARRARRNWTLLVQGADLHHDAAHALLGRFRFVPDARLDDLMISYAVDGGGVGPHVDSYDVFLLQAQGLRRWRIAPPAERALVPDAPVKLLAEFAPSDEWLLAPGDMLYLPPGWAHEGTALGECLTYSVGFRAPSRHEVLGAWLVDRGDAPIAGADPRFGDAGAQPSTHPGAIPPALHDALARWIADWRPRRGEIDDFIGRFLTEPKPGVWFQRPARRMSGATFARRVAQSGLRVDRRTRLVYRAGTAFINGESVRLTRETGAALRRMSNARALPPGAVCETPVDSPLLALLRAWFDAGWIHFSDQR